MINRTSHSILNRTCALLAIPASLALIACGGAPETGGSTLEDPQISEAKSALYGTFNFCTAASAGGVTATVPSGFVDIIRTESNLANRNVNRCDAWVVNFTWTTVPTSTEQIIMTAPRDMPTDETECGRVWTSDRIHGVRLGSFSTLHDRDSALIWNSGVCVTDGNSHFPSQASTVAALRLNKNASAVQDRITQYNSLRIINQPYWLMWQILGKVIYSG